MSLSARLSQIPASPIRKLVPHAQAAKDRGVTVHHLNIGDPDIPTPKVMLSRLQNWPEGIPYAQSPGDPELLAALKGYYHQLGHTYIDIPHLQVTVGGSEALAMAMVACCDPGDELIVFEPFFVGYAALAPVCGVKLVPVTTSIDTGFHLPPREVIEQAITPHTKAILFTNPNNPTGTVYPPAEVEMLIEISQQHGLYLWCDEVYREFVFDGRQPVSLLSYLPHYPEHLVVLDSLSKRYSAPGLRLGMLVSLNPDLMAGVLRMAMGRLSAGYIDQKVAAQISAIKPADIFAVRDEYQRRRDVVYQGLSSYMKVKPEGAFYCILDLPVQDADHFCQWLLTDFQDRGETVMLAPVAGFYATPGLGTNQVRLAYVLAVPKLARSIELLNLALKQYPISG